MKKGFTLIEILSVIVILAVISIIAYPKIIDVISISKVSAYNSAKGNIIESAKLKYLADVNSAKVIEYTVDDLISSGYLDKNTKNPITMKNYEDTKVLVTAHDNDVSFNYVDGKTLYDVVSGQDDSSGLYKYDDEYIFKGSNPRNYVSFDGQIYRILKTDEYHSIYLLKDEEITHIKKDGLNSYINSYYNDNYLEKVKNNLISFSLLSYSDYLNSFINDETYIINNSSIWVEYSDSFKYLSYLTNELTDLDNYGNVRFVLKLKNYLTVLSGDGSQLNPYVVNE